MTLWKYKYPAQRVSKQEDGTEVGVAGTMEKLQESQIADQPISGIRLLEMGMGLFYSDLLSQFFSKILSKFTFLGIYTQFGL